MIIMDNCCKRKFFRDESILQLSQQDKRIVQLLADAQINMSLVGEAVNVFTLS